MRIVRYTLDIVGYQQLQPLWPGRIVSVGATPPYDADGCELPINDRNRYRIDMWAMDNDTARGDRQPPILGVWIVGTGNPIDPAMLEQDAIFHGTVDHRPHGGAWHVFTAVIGTAESVPPPDRVRYSSVDEMADRIKERHRDRR